jgi:hypothetical protein
MGCTVADASVGSMIVLFGLTLNFDHEESEYEYDRVRIERKCDVSAARVGWPLRKAVALGVSAMLVLDV